jgi:flavin-dependent thymidylate synthase
MNELRQIEVLDHGYVRLVEFMGSDLSVVRSARVSYAAEWRAGEDQGSDIRLINYLMKNKHTSPFEAVSMTFEVKAPIFVFRQWHRHRTWCLAGSNSLIFNAPVDGKPYRVSLERIVKSWNPRTAKRRRLDQSPLSLEEHNRQRINAMRLRSPSGSVHIEDAWYSGEKNTYRVMTDYGEVTASAQHVFKTPDGSSRVEDGLRHVMAMVLAGDPKEIRHPEFTTNELLNERWVEFSDGYEVSNLGRIRTYWGQGARHKKAKPDIKKITISPNLRAVVSIKERGALQVSRLTYEAFFGSVPEGKFILHNDDNPLNNRLTNLRIGTMADNANDRMKNGRQSHLQEVPVEVKRIEKKGVQPTFDISVTGDHWFVADNLVVHNSYNEISARYSQLPDEFYLPEPTEVGIQSTDNKQVRTLRTDWTSEEAKDELRRSEEVVDLLRDTNRAAFETYKQLLKRGVPRELARTVLPVATYSKMFATVNLHNLFHFLKLRLHPHAQVEIRRYAEALLQLAMRVAPHSVTAFINTELATYGYDQKYTQR